MTGTTITQAKEIVSPPTLTSSKNLAFQWGMIGFLASEAAFFATLISAYVTFLGKDRIGPTPSQALSLPLVLGTTLVLVSSSVTIHIADKRLRLGDQAHFRRWWIATIMLGVLFLLGTAYEWHELATRHQLTISRNLFGTTYYTLVGFHGLHVTAGVVVMLIVLGLALGRQIDSGHRESVEMVSWYWHFVDAVWLVVFTGRLLGWQMIVDGGLDRMVHDPRVQSEAEIISASDTIEMPQATIAPLTLALALAMLAVGVIASPAFLVIGLGIFIAGLGLWIAHLRPGRGHSHERFVAPAHRAAMVRPRPSPVEHLHEGMPGYRLRLPTQVHPISAGVRGGIIGGIVMPIPALAYGLLSGHGIWYPINLLAGMVLPGIDRMTEVELEQFRWSFLLIALFIHAVMAVVLGLIYGVLLPTLPPIPRPMAWGGLLMPLLWTGVTFSLMGVVNPTLAKGVNWPWFIASQFIFGIAAAFVVIRSSTLRPLASGLLGGMVAGALMPVPAILWSLISGHGLWYPANLLAAMVWRGVASQSPFELTHFHASWLAIAFVVHVTMSIAFGIIYRLLLPMLGPIPGPLAWGGLLLPLLWTATSHSLMGVVNPILQERVDWPWFVVSQFVFGVVAAIVVLRSEMVYITPAGRGPENVTDFVVGPHEDRS